MAYGQVNADVIGTSVAGSNLGAGNATNFKNRIINGDMRIDQRNAGASVTPANTGANTYTLDRWFGYGSVVSKFSVQQNAGSVTTPVGFSNYLGVTSLSAYSVGAGDQFIIGQAIEGFNTADLGWGTANAKTVTLSFQIYSSLTGTFGGALRNSAANYSYPFSYSIPVANTWTPISVTVAGPTSGTWVGATNGIGINVFFGLCVGSTYSGTAGSWSANTYTSATGATSVVGTSGATFYITGVQLEVGSSATGFDFRDYGRELILCQRYYQTIPDGTIRIDGYGGAGYNATFSGIFAVTMRTSPTAVTSWSTATNITNGPFASATVSGFNGAGNTASGAFIGIVALSTFSSEL